MAHGVYNLALSSSATWSKLTNFTETLLLPVKWADNTPKSHLLGARVSW